MLAPAQNTLSSPPVIDDRLHGGVLEPDALQRVVQLDVDAEVVGVELEVVVVTQAAVGVDGHGQGGDGAVDVETPVAVPRRIGLEGDPRRHAYILHFLVVTSQERRMSTRQPAARLDARRTSAAPPATTRRGGRRRGAWPAGRSTRRAAAGPGSPGRRTGSGATRGRARGRAPKRSSSVCRTAGLEGVDEVLVLARPDRRGPTRRCRSSSSATSAPVSARSTTAPGTRPSSPSTSLAASSRSGCGEIARPGARNPKPANSSCVRNWWRFVRCSSGTEQNTTSHRPSQRSSPAPKP